MVVIKNEYFGEIFFIDFINNWVDFRMLAKSDQ